MRNNNVVPRIMLGLVVVALALFSLTFPSAGVGRAESFRAIASFLSHLDQAGGYLPLDETVVMKWRAPRVLAAVMVGAALAVAGALFQSVTQNPLGSPDIIGFNTGAYTGVIVAMLLGHGGFAGTVMGALVGGCAAAVVIVLLALRRGNQGLRLILVGIGVSMALASANKYLILLGDMETAMSAASWGAGSLNGLRWDLVAPGGAALALLLLATVGLGRCCDILDLGQDTAASLGLPVQKIRFYMIAVAVLITAVCTALAGPIAFVALAAPHLARMVGVVARQDLALTGLIGAALILASDIAAQRVFDPVQLPVGLVTVVFGGAYLLFFLARPQIKKVKVG